MHPSLEFLKAMAARALLEPVDPEELISTIESGIPLVDRENADVANLLLAESDKIEFALHADVGNLCETVHASARAIEKILAEL
jgi:hypothetical protein